MHRVKDVTNTIKGMLLFVVIVLVILNVSRLSLTIWQQARVSGVSGWSFVLAQGIRFDLVLIGLLLLLPASLIPLCATRLKLFSLCRHIFITFLSLCIGVILFMELATPSFLNQYDARPNFLFVEYLKYPKEVFSTLWAAYTYQLAIAFFLVPVTTFLSFQTISARWRLEKPLKWWKAALLTPLLGLILLMLARSTFDHRPINPSTVAFSTDPMVNDLALNSTYSVLYAVYESIHDAEGGISYGKMPEEKVLDLVKQEMHIEPSEFTNSAIPTLHRHKENNRKKNPLNLVIILEESMGAEFVGSLGGLPLTPHLDRLAEQGIWFENLYATGTRSVRGIEAVVAGFPPTPGRSAVKLPRSQRNFFTIAQLLRNNGYDTSFIYGGESHFDNMRRFFMNNGFNWVIDEDDFDAAVFRGSWGVSDEDLFERAHRKFSTYGEKPFFSLIFTSSNHSPFEFPDSRIDYYDPKKQTEKNAVKYADYALGTFFEKAKQSDYWEHTVFLVVADHNSRVRGASLVPIKRFHIPALILGPQIKPAIISSVSSQIDLPPTLLSLIGFSGEYPAIGRDLTDPKFHALPGRAIMQYYTTQAYMENNEVVIMQRDAPLRQFVYSDGKLIKSETENQKFMDKALAHSLWPRLTYGKALYHLP